MFVLEQSKQEKFFLLVIIKLWKVFQLIHCDLWGPYQTTAFCGARYFLTIVDEYSRATWIYLLIDKKEVSMNLCNFIAIVERQFNKQVKTVRSDNGIDFTCLGNYFSKHGIVHETSCVGTPQQNGRVECKHRHILNVARALRFQANLSIKFWGECILTAGYLINRNPSLILHGKTPYEILYGKTPPLGHMPITTETEPQTFAEAVKDERWRQAMKHEIQALENNDPWTMESLPLGKKAIRCKWVYRIKYNSDGSIERFKARLVI